MKCTKFSTFKFIVYTIVLFFFFGSLSFERVDSTNSIKELSGEKKNHRMKSFLLCGVNKSKPKRLVSNWKLPFCQWHAISLLEFIKTETAIELVYETTYRKTRGLWTLLFEYQEKYVQWAYNLNHLTAADKFPSKPFRFTSTWIGKSHVRFAFGAHISVWL